MYQYKAKIYSAQFMSNNCQNQRVVTRADYQTFRTGKQSLNQNMQQYRNVKKRLSLRNKRRRDWEKRWTTQYKPQI